MLYRLVLVRALAPTWRWQAAVCLRCVRVQQEGEGEAAEPESQCLEDIQVSWLPKTQTGSSCWCAACASVFVLPALPE